MTNPSPHEESGYETHLEEKLQAPKRYKVLLHNDDYTTMEFVVRVLKTVFRKNDAEATRIMLNIHNNGIGVCGVYTAEVAETRVALVHQLARQDGFPLKCSMEEV